MVAAAGLEPKFFISLDFGTHASGFAFACLNGDALLYHSYPDLPEQYPKTLTALLYERPPPGQAYGRPKAWGWSAQVQHLKLPEADRARHELVTNFKLALSPTNTTYNGVWQPRAGLPVDKLIADYLRELAALASATVQTRYTTFSPALTRWVVTVPADWGSDAKQTMRSAAHAAGITATLDSDSLLLLHEPEAAALCVQKRAHLELQLGSKFMVADLGGGTTDMTVHNVVQRGSGLGLGEACHRMGLLVGGKLLDKKFESIVRSQLGLAEYDSWKEDPKCAKSYLDFMGKWETIKKVYSSADARQSGVMATIQLPLPLTRRLSPKTRTWLENTAGDDYTYPVPGPAIRIMFDAVIKQVAARLYDMVNRSGAPAPKTLLVVGGLGSNPYLIDQIRTAFVLSGVSVEAPAYGYSAMLEGGVLFAQNPLSITTRCSRYTYGIAVCRTWRKGDPESSRFRPLDRFEDLCNVSFNKMVSRHQVVGLNEEVTFNGTPSSKHNNTVSFSLYRTEAVNPKYSTDPGMHLEATLRIKIDNHVIIRDHSEYKMRMTLRLGGTEITATAVDIQTGRSQTVKVAFGCSN